MYPLLITSLSACLLTSCTVSDFESKTPNPTPPVSVVESTTTPTNQANNETREILTKAYEEELLAHDIYTYMVTKYPELSSVNNTISSEAQHQASVGQLLDSRNIPRPTDYGSYTETYTTLKNMIDSSLTGAIEVGIIVETGDIDHLLEEYKKVTDTDVRRVFENIGGASFNHLRSFLMLARTYNYTPSTDWTKYLSETEATQGGPFMYKMTELLITNNLPTFGTQGGRNGGNGDGTGTT
jgi:hypothetical protein